MRRNGFTLVELLSVITLLALVSLITVPIVNKTINNSKQSTYDRQVEAIERASENWFLKSNVYLDNNQNLIVNLNYLLEQGYLKKSEITSTKTGEKLNGCVLISYVSNQYSYKFRENNCNCSGLTNCTVYSN